MRDTPLTPEEEAEVRRKAEDPRVYDSLHRRLLATLDRVRRERVDPAFDAFARLYGLVNSDVEAEYEATYGESLAAVSERLIGGRERVDPDLRAVVTKLIDAIDRKDEANVHGWSRSLRAILARQPDEHGKAEHRDPASAMQRAIFDGTPQEKPAVAERETT